VEHGSAAVCVTGDLVVMVTYDGRRWGLPGGRPEPGEDWADTLRREVAEEACATVNRPRLLGFSRGVCVRGPQAGLVLVRALWRAGRSGWRRGCRGSRCLVVGWCRLRKRSPACGLRGYGPMHRRIFAEAGLPAGAPASAG
jgi:ADP-ribose pyrophosphatase YjhB (NUDIX family)